MVALFVTFPGLSLVVASGGYSWLWCTALLLRWLLLLGSTGLRVCRHTCGSQARQCGPRSCGAWADLLCGMWNLPRPGIKLCPVHQQVDLYPLPLLQKENTLYLGHMAWFRPLGGKKKSENLRGLQRLKGFKSWQSEIAQSCPTLRPYGPYVAFQALSPIGFSRHEYWSGLPFPSPGDLPDSRIKLRSPTLQADSTI